MVDMASDLASSLSRKARRKFNGSVRGIVNRDAALSYIDNLPSDLISTGYQNPAFLCAWLNHADAEPFFVIIKKDGYGEVLLPLELHEDGTATYCGGTHANGNFPVGRAEDIAALSDVKLSALVAEIATLTGRPDVLSLERQHVTWRGIANPFVDASSSESPNVALSLSLEGGFASVLERHHGKRKRKRQRNHLRKLENLGTVKIENKVGCTDVPDVLNAFFAMKAVRFKEAGICDVFAETSVKNMFEQMFMESCASAQPKHFLAAIRLDGKPISVIGCTSLDGRLTVEFGAFDDAYAVGGPGDLLFYHAIEDACAQGLSVFDFGIGDEFYKRSWCDIETWHRDTIVAVTSKGRIRATYKIARNKAVRMIKTNKTVWSGIKTMRKHLGWMQKC